ncbi:hypothetical protein PR048_016539 [Dryococelus australis]|uniref:Uncharacterized protein n=1 Tax=Dryococelus australis TaxID=614101 RepID=A0ABQ9HK07_9NEOP|nr:hypothetical protein PR048_016539 [Dryococelus australis]
MKQSPQLPWATGSGGKPATTITSANWRQRHATANFVPCRLKIKAADDPRPRGALRPTSSTDLAFISSLIKSNTTSAEWKAMNDIQNNRDIIILSTDKGSTILKDSSTYRLLPEDPPAQFSDHLKHFLASQGRLQGLSHKSIQLITPEKLAMPVLYSLPKNQKTIATSRITHYKRCGSPTEKISALVNAQLQLWVQYKPTPNFKPLEKENNMIQNASRIEKRSIAPEFSHLVYGFVKGEERGGSNEKMRKLVPNCLVVMEGGRMEGGWQKGVEGCGMATRWNGEGSRGAEGWERDLVVGRVQSVRAVEGGGGGRKTSRMRKGAGPIPTFAWSDSENHGKPKSGWPDQESKPGLPKCKSSAQPLRHLDQPKLKAEPWPPVCCHPFHAKKSMLYGVTRAKAFLDRSYSSSHFNIQIQCPTSTTDPQKKLNIRNSDIPIVVPYHERMNKLKTILNYRHKFLSSSVNTQDLFSKPPSWESRLDVTSRGGAPKYETWRLSTMALHNAGFQIMVTAVAPNAYTAITVGHIEVGLVRKHYILPLSKPLMAFTCPLHSEMFVASGQWKQTQWHACQQSSLQCSSVEPTLWTRLYGLLWPCKQDGGHPDVVKLHGPVPVCRCVRPSSIHWFHTSIIVVAACPVRAEISCHEFMCDFRSKQPPCSSRADCPRLNVFWVRPHQNARMGEWEIPVKTIRPAVSSGTISHMQKMGATPPRIKPDSPRLKHGVPKWQPTTCNHIFLTETKLISCILPEQLMFCTMCTVKACKCSVTQTKKLLAFLLHYLLTCAYMVHLMHVMSNYKHVILDYTVRPETPTSRHANTTLRKIVLLTVPLIPSSEDPPAKITLVTLRATEASTQSTATAPASKRLTPGDMKGSRLLQRKQEVNSATSAVRSLNP